jgi:hypothetical protein
LELFHVASPNILDICILEKSSQPILFRNQMH